MKSVPTITTLPIAAAILVTVLWTFGCQPTDSNNTPPPSDDVQTTENPACAGKPKVQIDSGWICGSETTGGFPTEDARTVWAYRGIPYAASTDGTNRWKQAQPPVPWGNATLDATQFGPECSQIQTDPQTGTKSLAGSDHCLSVNVFTPVAPSTSEPSTSEPSTSKPGTSSPLPVMVFIHGGAYAHGTAGIPYFDGTNLAGGGDVVVVTMNYRLGVLGFLGAIDTGEPGGSANLGLLDQQLALQWVRDNVEHFGGDAGNVTLFGESAGASSVGVHLVNPDSQGLFHRGIMESNHYGMMFQTRETAKHRAKKLLKAVDCHGAKADQQLTCLQQAADADLQGFLEKAGPNLVEAGEGLLCNAFGGFEYWAPIIDDRVVTAQPVDTVITKPFMTGTNTNEGVLFAAIAGLYPEANGVALAAALDLIFGPVRGTEVEVAYPGLHHGSNKGVALAEVLTDYIWSCANNQVLNAAAAANNPDTYGYHFTHAPTISLYAMGTNDKGKPFVGNPCGPDASVNPDPKNVCHGNELPYVFGNPFGFTEAGPITPSMHSFQDAEKPMITQVMRFWTQYAKTGEPGDGFPKFADAALPAGQYQVLRDTEEGGFTVDTGLYDSAQCHLWQDKVKYKLNWMQKLCTHW